MGEWLTGDLLSLIWAPFLMCLVLTGIHAYLGIHVVTREVVFVDIAMAQVAALGATAAFLVGYSLESWESYFFGLGAAFLHAIILAFTRSKRRHVSQEAMVGVVYAVAAAATVLIVSRAPHGAEHLRSMLVGDILAVTGSHVLRVAILYGAIGLFHWFCRRPFFAITASPTEAARLGWHVPIWDFLFYMSFGIVVTSSVRVAGVLLVFAYLVVPALAALVLGGRIGRRLVIGWAFGAAASVLGMLASVVFDLPTGATVVCVFGVMLLGFWLCLLVSDWMAARVAPQAAGATAGSEARGGEPAMKDGR